MENNPENLTDAERRQAALDVLKQISESPRQANTDGIGMRIRALELILIYTNPAAAF